MTLSKRVHNKKPMLEYSSTFSAQIIAWMDDFAPCLWHRVELLNQPTFMLKIKQFVLNLIKNATSILASHVYSGVYVSFFCWCTARLTANSNHVQYIFSTNNCPDGFCPLLVTWSWTFESATLILNSSF